MESLYTFILEVDGGTYVSQRASVSLRTALVDWSRSLDSSLPPEALTKDSLSRIQIETEDSESPLVLLNGLENVWCLSVSSDQGYCGLNVVKTERAVTAPA